MLKEAANIKDYEKAPLFENGDNDDIEGFLQALRDLDCEYWAALYEQIFKDGYIEDKDALKFRIEYWRDERVEEAARAGHYLQEYFGGSKKQLNEARLIILGDKGAGKTSLTKKLLDPKTELDKDEESTEGVETHVWEIKEEEINVNIWDFAGHTVTHSVHKLFLAKRCLYILVLDGRTERIDSLYYWLNQVKSYGEDSSVIILVNKRDKHKVAVPINKLKSKYNNIEIEIHEVRINNIDEVTKFRNELQKFITDDLEPFPESYFNVKNDLEKEFKNTDLGKEKDCIKKSVFDSIAEKYKIENLTFLLQDFHDRGICLWYEGKTELTDFNFLVLNPTWITNGIYKIINWANNKGKHSVKLNDCPKIFEKDKARYSTENYEYLFELMKCYELAYKTDNGELIIPHLLEFDQPRNLPSFNPYQLLALKFETTVKLPPNLISRLIVKKHDKVQKDRGGNLKYWREGVVLDDGKGTIALVMEDDRTIEVKVEGEKRDYVGKFLNEIRNDLNQIFKDYKGVHPVRKYLVSSLGKFDKPFTSFDEEIWLDERQILTHAYKRELFYDYLKNIRIDLELFAESLGFKKDDIKYFFDKILNNMGDKNTIFGNPQIGALGSKSVAKKPIFQQNNYQFPANYNFEALASELAQLKEELGKQKPAYEFSSKELEDLKSITEAEEAAKEKDGNKVIEALKKTGKWTLDVATGIGVNLASEVLKGNLPILPL